MYGDRVGGKSLQTMPESTYVRLRRIEEKRGSYSEQGSRLCSDYRLGVLGRERPVSIGIVGGASSSTEGETRSGV